MEGSIQQVGNTGSSRCRTLLLLAATVLFLTALGVIFTDKAHAQDTDPGGDFVDGEIVTKLNLAALGPAETCRAAIDGINISNGTIIKEVFLENRNVACIYLLQSSPGADTEQVAGSIAANPKVRYAEPNFTIEAPEGERWRHRGYPGSDPSQPSPGRANYATQYAVGALGLTRAHGVNRGAGSTVAVLDTGVQQDHPELAGRVVKGESFVKESTTTADTGNGQDDDNDQLVDEMVGHGTHVAGIVHLAAPDAKIMPLRVLDSDGNGNVFLLAEAVQYAVDPDGNPGTDDGVDVISMSLGSSRESDLIQDVSDDLDAIDDDDDDDETGRALTGVPVRGTVVVGSAGNEDAEQPRYPSAEEGVIGVASVDEEEKKSGFSNYGGMPQVDVSVPGTGIYSTFPDNQYASWSGTSMAAPFVAGQAALIRSMRPGLPSTGQQGQPSVGEYITTTARSIDEANKNTNWAGKLGAGHANVHASLIKANTAPTISSMRPLSGSRTRDRTPLISATVGDSQTNLTKSNLLLYLDGRRIGLYSYNTGTDRLTRTASRLSYGYHRVKLTARDAQGRSTTRTWGFGVVR